MARVFFITGTSTGFGNELVKKVLQSGDIAVAASRNSAKLSFEGASPKNYLGVDLDVTSEKSVESAFEKAVSQFKTIDVTNQKSVDNAFSKATSQFKNIDVVVNNAGYRLNGEFALFLRKFIRPL